MHSKRSTEVFVPGVGYFRGPWTHVAPRVAVRGREIPPLSGLRTNISTKGGFYRGDPVGVRCPYGLDVSGVRVFDGVRTADSRK